jgi:hypothetical protein
VDKEYAYHLEQCINGLNSIDKTATKDTVKLFTKYVLGTLYNNRNKFIGSVKLEEFETNPVICDLMQLEKLKYGRTKEERTKAKEEMMVLVIRIRMRLQDTLDILTMEV